MQFVVRRRGSVTEMARRSRLPARRGTLACSASYAQLPVIPISTAPQTLAYTTMLVSTLPTAR